MSQAKFAHFPKSKYKVCNVYPKVDIYCKGAYSIVC